MRATIDWSYRLLPPPEQRLFARLGIFRGSWTIESASAVCAFGELPADAVLDQLAQLVDKSLVLGGAHAGSNRYDFLTVTRDYAREVLGASGDAPQAQRQLVTYVRELAGRVAADAARRPTSAWFAAIAAEAENVRAVLGWALAERNDVASGCAIAADLWPFWDAAGTSRDAVGVARACAGGAGRAAAAGSADCTRVGGGTAHPQPRSRARRRAEPPRASTIRPSAAQQR